jgi:hypothetical protein
LLVVGSLNGFDGLLQLGMQLCANQVKPVVDQGYFSNYLSRGDQIIEHCNQIVNSSQRDGLDLKQLLLSISQLFDLVL